MFLGNIQPRLGGPCLVFSFHQVWAFLFLNGPEEGADSWVFVIAIK